MRGAAATFRDWFHTGDLAWLDDEGDLHFHARVSERLRVRAEMVPTYEIEEAVLTHPAVEDCAVIGLPDGNGEETVYACVTLRPGTVLEPSALREFCAARMSRFMVPETVAVLDGMPRTPSGKPAKAEIRARASVAAAALNLLPGSEQGWRRWNCAAYGGRDRGIVDASCSKGQASTRPDQLQTTLAE